MFIIALLFSILSGFYLFGLFDCMVTDNLGDIVYCFGFVFISRWYFCFDGLRHFGFIELGTIFLLLIYLLGGFL